MKNIGYPDTKNKLGGGPSPLKGIFGAAVGAAKSTTKKKGKSTTTNKNIPKKNKGESVFEYTARLAKHIKSNKGKIVKDTVKSSGFGESSDEL